MNDTDIAEHKLVADMDAQERLDVAAQALTNLKMITPMLHTFVQALTGSRLIVKATGGTPRTDGKTIYVRPPFRMGLPKDHPEELGRDELMATLCHELAHIIYDSTASLDNGKRLSALRDGIDKAGWAEAQQRLDALTPTELKSPEMSSYLGLAKWLHPALPVIVNALEDARVNARIGEARPGVKRLLDERLERAMSEGFINDDTGEHRPGFHHATLNFQVALAIYLDAAGSRAPHMFIDKANELAADPTIQEYVRKATEFKSSREVFRAGVGVLARLQELGHFPSPPPKLTFWEQYQNDLDEFIVNWAGSLGFPAEPWVDAAHSKTDMGANVAHQWGQVNRLGMDDFARRCVTLLKAGSDITPASGIDLFDMADLYRQTFWLVQHMRESPRAVAVEQLQDLKFTYNDDLIEYLEGVREIMDGFEPPQDTCDENEGDEDGESEDTDNDDDADDSNDSGEESDDDTEGDGASDDDGSGDEESVDDTDGEGAGDGGDLDADEDEESDDDTDGEGAGDGGDPDADEDEESDGDGGGSDDEESYDDTPHDGGSDADSDESGDDDTDDDSDGSGGDDSGESDDDSDDESGMSGAGDDVDDANDSSSSGEGSSGPVDGQDGESGDESGDSQESQGDSGQGAEADDIDMSGASDPSDPQSDSTEPSRPTEATQGKPEMDDVQGSDPDEDFDWDNFQREMNEAMGHEDQEMNDDGSTNHGEDEGATELELIEGRSMLDRTTQSNVASVDVRPPEVTGPFNRECWTEYPQTKDVEYNRGIMTRTVGDLRRVLEANDRSMVERNLRRGPKVSARHLAVQSLTKGDRVFAKRHLPRSPEYHFVIAVDVSASTSGYRIKRQRKMAKMLGDMLHALDISFEVILHTMDWIAIDADDNQAQAMQAAGLGGLDDYGRLGYFDQVISYLKSTEDRWPSVSHRCAMMAPSGGNLDGHMMQLCRRSAEASGKQAIIVYCTDGKMPAANETEEKEILTNELRICKRLDIPVIGIGIDTDSPNKYGLDTLAIREDEDLAKLPAHLGKYVR